MKAFEPLDSESIGPHFSCCEGSTGLISTHVWRSGNQKSGRGIGAIVEDHPFMFVEVCPTHRFKEHGPRASSGSETDSRYRGVSRGAKGHSVPPLVATAVMTRALGLVVLIHTAYPRRAGAGRRARWGWWGTEPACGLPASLVPPMSAGSRTAGWGHFCSGAPQKEAPPPRNTPGPLRRPGTPSRHTTHRQMPASSQRSVPPHTMHGT